MSRALICAVLVTVAVVLPASASTSSLVLPRLYAKVTAKKIYLTDSAGRRVRETRPNMYKIVVADLAKGQNFHLTGPDVNRKTRIAARGNATWKLTLAPGKYVYRSDKNKKLRGSFIVAGPSPA